MKSLLTIALVALLSISNASAKGVASVKVKQDVEAKKEHVALALTIDEKIVGPLAYHSYTDIGDNSRADGYKFLTTHQLDLAISKFILSPGAALRYVSADKDFDKEVFVKLGYELW